ncbi:MAG: DUF4255 domain-containing protein [Spirulina sp. SIO3F2]|nr:DUF4255 domain-containing protein [Spirulina sp. SIO3F2]
MSNHLALATVTATLQRLLQAAVQGDVSGSRVTTLRPDAIGTATPAAGVNLFLYHIPMNYIWGNALEIKRRQRPGEMAKRSRTALDLHYMISFYGNDAELEPQRLLGSVIRTLTDQESITKQDIIDTLDDSNLQYLSFSDLPEKVTEISFSPLNLTLEELSKVWSVFFQTPYCLSVAYKATVVMIEGEAMSEQPIPISGRQMGNMSPLAGRPRIKEVTAEEGRFHPIETMTTLLIRGKYLKGYQTMVRIGEVEVAPSKLEDNELLLPLETIPIELLAAGVQSLQVVYQQSEPKDDESGSVVESNVAPFVLRPTVVDIAVKNLRGTNTSPRRCTVVITVNLAINQSQNVLLALNELAADQPVNYSFEVKHDLPETKELTVDIEGIKSGDYLVRLFVDGAETNLITDSDPKSRTYGLYVGPKLTLI